MTKRSIILIIPSLKSNGFQVLYSVRSQGHSFDVHSHSKFVFQDNATRFPLSLVCWLRARLRDYRSVSHGKDYVENTKLTRKGQRVALQQSVGLLMEAAPLMLIHVPMWVLSKQSQRQSHFGRISCYILTLKLPVVRQSTAIISKWIKLQSAIRLIMN